MHGVGGWCRYYSPLPRATRVFKGREVGAEVRNAQTGKKYLLGDLRSLKDGRTLGRSRFTPGGRSGSSSAGAQRYVL